MADLVNDDLVCIMSSTTGMASTRFAGWSPIHVALRQLIATKEVGSSILCNTVLHVKVLHTHHMGGSGPLPDSRLLCHGIHKTTKWVEIGNWKVKND